MERRGAKRIGRGRGGDGGGEEMDGRGAEWSEGVVIDDDDDEQHDDERGLRHPPLACRLSGARGGAQRGGSQAGMMDGGVDGTEPSKGRAVGFVVAFKLGNGLLRFGFWWGPFRHA